MKFLKQPKSVLLLSFVEMWNRFSHYGMRALLVFYMIKVLKYSDATAIGIFATFTAIDRIGGLFGAAIADKILGLRRSILLGGWIVACGHLLLALGYFLPGLSTLVIGSSLFTTNITGFIGHFYDSNDESRQSGYTFFYMAINVGAMLATIFCGLLAENFGWEYGFGLAAIGMVIGNLALIRFRPLLQAKGGPQAHVSLKKKAALIPLLGLGGGVALLALSLDILAFLPWVAGGAMLLILRKLRGEKTLIVFLIAYILFIAVEAQIPTSLIVFADKSAPHAIFGIPMATTSLLVVNPIVVIGSGAFVTLIYRKLTHPFGRFLLPFMLSAVGCLILLFGSAFFETIPTALFMTVVAVIAFAEIWICPVTYAACSKISVIRGDPKIMSLIPLAYAMGFCLGGLVGKYMAKIGYVSGFWQLAVGLIVCGLILGKALLQCLPSQSKIT